jgi:hypothetical protein
MFRAVASLSSDVLMLINKEFERDPSSIDALPLNAEIRIPAMLFAEENRQPIPRGGALLKFNVEHQLSRKNWLQWQFCKNCHQTGTESEMLQIPRSI